MSGDLTVAIQKASELFDKMTVERHELGQEKYGAFKFLGANTVEEAMFELVDLSNYARYTFIKLALMNDQLDEKLSGLGIDIGPDSLIPSKPSMPTDGG
jgi:hypothetical protein